MSLDLIDDLATEEIQVTRSRGGEWIQGRFEAQDPLVFSISASVQPLSANEIRQEPEHRRTAEMIKIYVFEELETNDERTLRPADVVRHDGKDFEIHKVSNWSIGTDLPHFKAVGVKKDGEGGGTQ